MFSQLEKLQNASINFQKDNFSAYKQQYNWGGKKNMWKKLHRQVFYVWSRQ